MVLNFVFRAMRVSSTHSSFFRAGRLGRAAYCRSLSSYQQEASHNLQASQSVMSPEQPLYNEFEVQQWLATFPGGRVDLEMDDDSGIATVTVCNPQKRNAFTGQMMVELGATMGKLEKWERGRAVVVRGAEGNFCSGGDQAFMKAVADPSSGSRMSIFMQAVTSKLFHLPMLSVALVEGHALGGGAELAIACDFRVCTPGARLGFVQSKIGVSTGWGGGTNLVRLFGPRLALRLLASGQVLTAEEAKELKIVEEVLEAESSELLLAQAKEWLAKNYLASSRPSVLAAKQIVRNAKECDYGESLNRERDIFTSVWGGPDHLKALEKMIKQT